MSGNEADKVTGFLKWIAPAGGLESMVEEPRLREEISRPPWATDAEMEVATEAVRLVAAEQPLRPEHVGALEAIILPQERPVVDVVRGSFDTPPAPFVNFGGGAYREHIEAAIPSIGRIDLPENLNIPYGGTGFVIGADLVMTNRHVAELFAEGLGREELTFRAGQTAAIDFLRERDDPTAKSFRVTRIVMIHPYWDMALLATEGLAGIEPLRLSVADPGDLARRPVAVIGYPALDPRNNVELQNRIFRNLYYVKRMQPGLLRARREIDSFDHLVDAVTHDASTLGGNSGSAVVDVGTGEVVALHFAGRYLDANFAVPSAELARDRRVAGAGVTFAGAAGGGSVPWDRYWGEADPDRGRGESAGRPPAAEPPRPLGWTIPLEIAIEVRSPAAAPVAMRAVAAGGASTEALVEPFRDEDLSTRGGYDQDFLGVRVPPPAIIDESVVSRLEDGSHELAYEHFSVVLHKARRLALFTAANVDASEQAKRPEPGRDYSRKGLTGLGEHDQERWFTDPRVLGLHQLPDRFFTKDRASFDKGHIVRREDVAWGRSYDEVRRANGDTFHVTNCSPQVAGFNRSNLHGLWGELENIVLAQAREERYCLFAGPVLDSKDPIFRGVDDDGAVRVAIPRRYWKVVVAHAGDGLQTFAFVLEQDLAGTDLEFAVPAEWRKRMIAVRELQDMLGTIEFAPELHATDQHQDSG